MKLTALKVLIKNIVMGVIDILRHRNTINACNVRLINQTYKTYHFNDLSFEISEALIQCDMEQYTCMAIRFKNRWYILLHDFKDDAYIGSLFSGQIMPFEYFIEGLDDKDYYRFAVIICSINPNLI